MYLEFKFTHFTLGAACFISVLLGIMGALLLKVMCDNVCCREKSYDGEGDDSEGGKKYETIRFK